MVMWGFVERVGDPIPLIAQDGSAHRGDALTADALESLARAVGAGTPPAPTRITIAVPAYWGPAALGALRGALRSKRDLLSDGAPPELISDAAAALAALQTGPGLPSTGVVALCDFGGNGTTIALADAGSGIAARSARSCGTATCPASRSTRPSSTTCWPGLPTPVTPIPREPPRSVR